MTDEEIVRLALGELSTYGDHARHSPLDLPAVAALDRILAERDAALKLVDDTVETLIRAAVKATDKEIEVVPIATENIFGKVKP